MKLESSYAFRSMLVAPKDHVLIQWDLAQAESWIVAHLTDDDNMKYSLKHGDIHTDTAIDALGLWKPAKGEERKNIPKNQRYMGKQANHAYAYRMGFKKGAEIINKRSHLPPYVTVTGSTTKQHQMKWTSYYNVKPWWKQIEDKLSATRMLVNCYGQVRTFYDQWGSALFNEATAFEPQSTVADHWNGQVHPDLGIEGGVLTVYDEFVVARKAIKIVNQAHDSMMAEVHKDIVDDIVMPITLLLRRPLVVNDMEFTIPVDCEIGERNGEFETYKLEL